MRNSGRPLSQRRTNLALFNAILHHGLHSYAASRLATEFSLVFGHSLVANRPPKLSSAVQALAYLEDNHSAEALRDPEVGERKYARQGWKLGLSLPPFLREWVGHPLYESLSRA